MSTSLPGEASVARRGADVTTFSIILALSFSHFLNDMIQSLVPALYPMLKGSYGLSFAQIGLITLTMQATSSLLQPAVGAGIRRVHACHGCSSDSRLPIDFQPRPEDRQHA